MSLPAASELESWALRALDAGVDLPYLLRFTPSLVVTSDAGTGIGYTGMRIRGSDGTRINVTLNGVPINDAESHQVYWVNMPDVAGSVDGLQIQRCAGTSTNGPGAFGATVAMSTLAMSAQPSARAVLGGGAFGTLRTTLQWSSGQLGDGWALEGRATRITSAGYATDNLAFGMGGALLQRLDRDTQKFALKCSAARVDGEWIDVYKDPVTDKGKQSKRGRMTLLRHREYGGFRTVPVPASAASLDDVERPAGYDDAMVTVWEDGRLQRDWTFAEIRARADAARL